MSETQGTRRLRERTAGEAGAVLGSWLVQALVVLLVLGGIGYEVISIGLTAVAVDDGSRQVARLARDAYRASDRSLDLATEAAVEAAATHQATVTDVSLDGEELTVTLERRAPTLVVHRIGPMADIATRSATGRAGLTPG